MPSRLRDPRPAVTPRERDVLAQLAQGLPNHAVARAPHLSEATSRSICAASTTSSA
ncbi:hypothetical protein SGPA1_21492 [Streptomyces misionensis JCM 4497]